MDNKKTHDILVVMVSILAIVFVGVAVMRLVSYREIAKTPTFDRRGDGRQENRREGDGQAMDKPAKGNMMQAVVPADLTPDQLNQLKAGVSDHKPGELTFNITGGSFYYAPNEIRVKQGDKVKIVFTNAGGMHNLIFDDFNVKTKDLKTGESETIEFTANKKGTFEFYCGIGNGYHRQKGQIGVLLVE